MNAPDRLLQIQTPADLVETSRMAALDRFAIEKFQKLSMEDLLLAKVIAGHGEKWGIWKTNKAICPSKLGDYARSIDFAQRIRHFIPQQTQSNTAPDVIDHLVQEGVLVLTRLALLMRLAPTGGIGKSKDLRIKPSSLAHRLYAYWPVIAARAILRKANSRKTETLLSCLTHDDVQELCKAEDRLRIELNRLGLLAARAWWTDVPPNADVTQPTDPRGFAPQPTPQKVPGAYQPLPDAYLEAFGPRNLWVIRELGPCLLPLLEDLATHLENLDWDGKHAKFLTTVIVPKFIAQHQKNHPWLDSRGRPLRPEFPLKTGATKKDNFEFPPRGWSQLKVLSATLQSAHLFLTYLASTGRMGEVDTLTRSCVTIARDGKHYLKGWTYKLSDNLFGDKRQWPAPTILVQALGQQVRLAEVWLRLPPKNIADGLPMERPTHSALWLSLGVAQNANSAEPLAKPDNALQMLADRIGMDKKPGGINLHPHRLRKTIGRLAGIALFNSPTVLKRLFGHKSIEMTLHYILCDRDIQTQAESVLRELRIMHCAEALEEVREAMTSGAPLPAHSGKAATRLVDAVQEHEARLAASGRKWKDGSAYDLAYLLTTDGNGWRFIQKDTVVSQRFSEESELIGLEIRL